MSQAADQAPHVHVSLVHGGVLISSDLGGGSRAGVGAGGADGGGGVQDWLSGGFGVSAVGQSYVRLQILVSLPA